jgi:hypothetical protein
MAKELDSFYSKIAGVSRRQRAVVKCDVGDRLLLVREPDNDHDSNAVKIMREDGDFLGYIPSETAEELAERMDAGEEAWAEITTLTGGTDDKPTRGVNIEVFLEKELAQWRVEGAMKKTGEDHVVIIDAANEKDAEKEARRGGLLVASVVRVSPLQPVITKANQPRGVVNAEGRVKLFGIDGPVLAAIIFAIVIVAGLIAWISK